MALQIAGLDQETADQTGVRLPTTIEFIERRLMLERVFEHAYLEHPVLYKGNTINLHWDEGLDTEINLTYSIQDGRQRIYLEGTTESRPGDPVNIGHPARLWEGRYYAVLRPTALEWWEYDMRYEKRIPIQDDIDASKADLYFS